MCDAVQGKKCDTTVDFDGFRGPEYQAAKTPLALTGDTTLRDLGYGFSLDDLKKARDHRVGPEYVRELTALGCTRLSLDDLIRLRDHGVTTKEVRDRKLSLIDRPFTPLVFPADDYSFVFLSLRAFSTTT